MNGDIATEDKKYPTALSTPSPTCSMNNNSSIQKDPQTHHLQNKDQLPLSPSLSSSSSCYSQTGFADTPGNVSNLPSSPNEKTLYSLSFSPSSPLVFPSSAPRDTFSQSEEIKGQKIALSDSSLDFSPSKDMLISSAASNHQADSKNVGLRKHRDSIDFSFTLDKPEQVGPGTPASDRIGPGDFDSKSDKLQPSLPIVDSSMMSLLTSTSSTVLNKLDPADVPKKALESTIDDIISSPAIPIPPRSSNHTHERSLHGMGEENASSFDKKSSSVLSGDNIINLQKSSAGNNFLDNIKQAELISTVNRTASAPSTPNPVLSTPDNNSEASFLTTKSSDKHKPLVTDRLLELQSENTQLWKLVKEQQAMIIDLQSDLNAMAEKNKHYKAELAKYKNTSSKLSQDDTSSITKTSQDIEKSLDQFSNLSIEKGFNKNSKPSNSKPVQELSQSPSPGPDSVASGRSSTDTQLSPAAKSLRSSRERASPIANSEATFDFQIKPSSSALSVSILYSLFFFFANFFCHYRTHLLLLIVLQSMRNMIQISNYM
jgi:hypothetical protein